MTVRVVQHGLYVRSRLRRWRIFRLIEFVTLMQSIGWSRRDHLRVLTARVGIGIIFHSSNIARFVQGVVVNFFRCLSLVYRMRTKFLAFEANCESCHHRFMHPELGDMAYGEFIFTTSDGRHRAYCNALDAGPKRIHELMDGSSPECFQAALAHFADALDDGSRYTNSLRCPKCAGSSLSRCLSENGQPSELARTTYLLILALPRDELAAALAEFDANWRG